MLPTYWRWYRAKVSPVTRNTLHCIRWLWNKLKELVDPRIIFHFTFCRLTTEFCINFVYWHTVFHSQHLFFSFWDSNFLKALQWFWISKGHLDLRQRCLGISYLYLAAKWSQMMSCWSKVLIRWKAWNRDQLIEANRFPLIAPVAISSVDYIARGRCNEEEIQQNPMYLIFMIKINLTMMKVSLFYYYYYYLLLLLLFHCYSLLG